MHALVRNLYSGCLLLLPLAAALSPVLNAQAPTEDGPPNVLVIHREYLKPGKGGMLHDRSESAFVKAFADAKSPYHYFALDSLSGPSRSLVPLCLRHLCRLGKGDRRHIQQQSPGLESRPGFATGWRPALDYDAAAMTLRPDLSLNKGSIDGARYFEITVFVVKPGHVHDFTELTKLYIDTFHKIAPDAHWDTFEVMYGSPLPGAPGGGVFLVFNLMKSLAETDKSMKDSDKFAAELGTAGMQKVSELTAASIQAEVTNLFAINPRISNPPAGWVKKDPGFWKMQ